MSQKPKPCHLLKQINRVPKDHHRFSEEANESASQEDHDRGTHQPVGHISRSPKRTPTRPASPQSPDWGSAICIRTKSTSLLFRARYRDPDAASAKSRSAACRRAKSPPAGCRAGKSHLAVLAKTPAAQLGLKFFDAAKKLPHRPQASGPLFERHVTFDAESDRRNVNARA